MARGNTRGSDNRHDTEILAQAEKFKAAKTAADREAAAAKIRAEVDQANREHPTDRREQSVMSHEIKSSAVRGGCPVPPPAADLKSSAVGEHEPRPSPTAGSSAATLAGSTAPTDGSPSTSLANPPSGEVDA